jgi:nitrilase
MSTILRAAACHASPVFLNALKTTEKCISLVNLASRNSAHLVVFPESYIPAFPLWSAVRAPAQNHHFFARMAAESVYADGEEVKAIRHAAKQTNTTVSLGISEKVRYSSATLFNTNLIIGADGEVRVHHRKLMPTFFEKLTWSPGDGFGLRVVEAGEAKAKVGALICGENTNPLARYSLMGLGEQVHISTWPAVWPTRMVEGFLSTKDAESGERSGDGPVGRTRGANYDNLAANKTRAAAHCFEAKCFGILCSGHLDRSAMDTLSAGDAESSPAMSTLTHSNRAATMFLDPTGALLPGFTIDESTGEKKVMDMLQMEEGILYADLDLADCVEGKQYHDVVGGYQRLDVFDLKVGRRRRSPVRFNGDNAE